MLCQIKIPFTSRRNLHYEVLASSVMHGILMENISPDYAGKMHEKSLRPFSQYVHYENNCNFWTISTLDREAYENIIIPLLSLKTTEVRHKNDTIYFHAAEQKIISYNELIGRNNISVGKSIHIRIDFITPTAFRSSGSYVNIPSARLILNNLARRFDVCYGIQNNNYEIFLSEVEKYVSITEYSLNSKYFSLEGKNVPAFMGYIIMRITGDLQLKSYLSMLCEFAAYSGTGIKTALGMGQVISAISRIS